MIKNSIKRLLPKNTRRFKTVRRIAQFFGFVQKMNSHPDKPYEHWVEFVESRCWVPYDAAKIKSGPLISIIVPAYNTPAKYLMPLIYSVINQTYEKWELIIVNASDDQASKQRVDAVAQHDTRIKIINVPKNFGISGNTNSGIKHATGAYIAFCDHDDTLAPQALYEVAVSLNVNKKLDFIYSDEDKLSEDGFYRQDPHFKSDFSLSLLRELNYINHFSVMRASLVNDLGGLREEFDGAQDYDLLLRAYDTGMNIGHIAKVLYHWRIADNSTASDISTKSYVLEAGTKALNEHIKRNKLDAQAEAMQGKPGYYKINFSYNNYEVGVIINARMGATHVRQQIKQFRLEGVKIKIVVMGDYRTDAKDADVIVLPSGHSLEAIYSHLNTCDAVYVLNMPVNGPYGWIKESVAAVLGMPEVGVLMPAVIDRHYDAVDLGLIRAPEGYRPLYKGSRFAKHFITGDSDWVRDVDIFTGSIFVAPIHTLKSAEYAIGKEMQLFERISQGKQLFTVWSHVTVTAMSSIDYQNNAASGLTDALVIGAVNLKLPYNNESIYER